MYVSLLLFFIVLAKASRRPAKKTCRTPVAACLSSSHPCQRTSLSPSSFPPRPRTVPGPKAGAKISQFFIPLQTFLQLFCEKISPENPTAWKTTGNRNVFSPAGHVHPGDVLRIPATKRAPPPTRASRKSSPPCWKTGTRNPWPQNHKRAIMRKPRFLPPEIPSGHAPRPHPHKARSVYVHGALRVYLRSTFASLPRHCRPIQRLYRGCDAKARRTYTITTP